MKVCVDVQSAIAQRAGVGRYTKILVEHLDRRIADHELVLFYFDFHRRGQPIPVQNARERAVRWCPGKIAQQGWKRFGFPPFECFAGKADLYHFPNFVIPPMRGGRKIVSIHDVSFLRYPEFAERKNLEYLNAHIPATVAKADAIITISHFSAREIETQLGVPPEKIHVTHLGIATDFCRPDDDTIAAVKRTHALDRPYLLFVGTLEPRKNIPFLVEAFERMTDFDGDLVLAGMRGWQCDPILDRLRASPRADRIRWLEYPTDDQLPGLYAGAELFVIASHYEGFGFPPVEAMACETPVLSSCGGSLPEVLGDAARIVPEFDAELWAREAMDVMGNASERDRMTRAGRERAAGYTWQNTADATWKIYESVLR